MAKAERPGDVLLNKYMKPMGISQYQLSKAVGKPQATICGIVNGKRSISFEMAWLLGKALGTTAEYWINLELKYWVDTLDKSTMPTVTPLYDKSFREAVAESSPNVTMLGDYVDAMTRIPVRCNVCGCEWSVYPKSLRSGAICPDCLAREKSQR